MLALSRLFECTGKNLELEGKLILSSNEDAADIKRLEVTILKFVTYMRSYLYETTQRLEVVRWNSSLPSLPFRYFLSKVDSTTSMV